MFGVRMENLFQTGNHAAKAILKNEKALLPENAPPGPLLRENEMKEIADAIIPLLSNNHSENLFIHGPSGSGKQTSIRFILQAMRKQTSRVVPVYVNCWEYPTQMGVYSKIIEALGISLPRRGLATDEVFTRIRERIDRDGTSILLVLDKVHSLILRGEENIFHTLARANDNNRTRFGVVSISSDSHVLNRLSPPLRSLMHFTTLEFKEYTLEQLITILSNRASKAFTPGACPGPVLAMCAKIAKVNKGNVRLALEILWKAARRAERRGRRRISVVDVKAVSSKTDYARTLVEDCLGNFNIKGLGLSDDEKLALRIIARKGQVNSSDFYNEFMSIRMKSKRQIRNYLELLGAKGLIQMRPLERAGLLNGRMIQLLCKR